MTRYAIRRLALLLPLLLGVSVVVFGLMQIVPGDPAAVLLGQDATPEAVETLRQELGLDRPLPVQLGSFITRVARGDLGQSIFRREPVVMAIADRMPATVEVAIVSLVFAVAVGLVLGTLAALRRGSTVDTATMLFAQIGVSMPVYWLGILLMFAFAVQLDWLPAVGRGEPLFTALGAALAGRPGVLIDSLRHLALPALTLGLYGAAVMSRVVRASMLNTMSAGHIRTARAKGLGAWRIVSHHALRNALLPVISIIGLRFGELLGGAVLTESIFGWPGLGQLTVTAISQRDLPLVQGTVLVFALMFALVNLMVDLTHAGVDPRLRTG